MTESGDAREWDNDDLTDVGEWDNDDLANVGEWNNDDLTEVRCECGHILYVLDDTLCRECKFGGWPHDCEVGPTGYEESG
jgi:hypothetical protein